MNRRLDRRPAPGVIFDFDGILVDSAEVYRQALSEAVAPVARSDWPKLYGMTTMEAVEYAAAGRLPQDHLETISTQIDRRVGELLARTPPARSGAESTVRALKGAGVRLAVASSASRFAIDGTLEALGWGAHFEVVVGREDAPRPKPAPDIYLEAVRRLRLAAGEASAIEDTEIGVRAARDAGLFAVALGGTQTETELAAADMYCADFEALQSSAWFARLVEGGE